MKQYDIPHIAERILFDDTGKEVAREMGPCTGSVVPPTPPITASPAEVWALVEAYKNAAVHYELVNDRWGPAGREAVDELWQTERQARQAIRVAIGLDGEEER